MPRREFLQLTPEEFSAAAISFYKAEEQRMRDCWEQTRIISFFAVSPHINQRKARLTPHKLLPFPWDNTKETIGTDSRSKDELKERFLQLKAARDGK